jgi:hypothetical protein
MKKNELMLLAGVGAFAYWWFYIRPAQNTFATVTSNKNACPGGYSLEVDSAGRGVCKPFNSPGWQDNGGMDVVQKSENMVYDSAGNLVSLDSVFAQPANFQPLSTLTGK